ncbi:MAG: GntR family transcriptional regulator [Loktanella sp.]|nr:GntR family transcriptional regulator [Loktanella sp.]
MQDVSEPHPGLNGGNLQRESLQQQVFDNLRSAIMSGVFRPGEVLSSRGLAQQLGVSAMPVREALTRLTTEGVLQNTPSRTLRLRVLSPSDFDEITAIRFEIEGMAAERACGAMTTADLAEIRALNDALTAAASSGDADHYLKANADYHAAIYRVSGWPLLVGMIERLWLMVGPSIRMSVPDRAHMATSQEFHDQIMTALDARDGKTVRAAIVDDISTAARDIRASLAPEAAHPQMKEE